MIEFQKAIESGALPFGVQATENILTLDGGRTIGWELAEVLEENPVDDLFIQVGGEHSNQLRNRAVQAARFKRLSKVPRIWAFKLRGAPHLMQLGKRYL